MGLSAAEKTAKRDEDIKKVVDTIKSLGDCTIKDIAVLLDMEPQTIRNLFNRHPEEFNSEHIVRENTGRGGTSTIRYDPPAPEPVSETPYNDPTARKAIFNMDQTNYKFIQEPGELWWDNSTTRGLFLIVSKFKNTANCLVVKDMDNWFDESVDIPVTLKDNKQYYISPYRVVSRPIRNFYLKECELKKERFDDILGEIAAYLNIPPVIKYVEKTVTKEVKVEVPVEKIVEVPITNADPTLEWKAKMWDEAWPQILKGLAK